MNALESPGFSRGEEVNRRNTYGGQGGNQFGTRLPDELAQAGNALAELRTVVDNPPWETAPNKTRGQFRSADDHVRRRRRLTDHRPHYDTNSKRDRHPAAPQETPSSPKS